MKIQKTLRQLLDEGYSLTPIVNTPFSNTTWRIGVYYNGIRHALFKEHYATSTSCQVAINELMKIYLNDKLQAS